MPGSTIGGRFYTKLAPSLALSSYLGTLARNAHIAPLTYTTWREMKDNWEDMRQPVKVSFFFLIIDVCFLFIFELILDKD